MPARAPLTGPATRREITSKTEIPAPNTLVSGDSNPKCQTYPFESATPVGLALCQLRPPEDTPWPPRDHAGHPRDPRVPPREHPPCRRRRPDEGRRQK